MTDLRQDSMTGEQWVLEERSADPPSTEEGERWLRTDLNSGDKIATLRVDVGSSIHDVPIFSTGTAVDTVSEAMRIQVNGTTGYVPIAPVSDAAFPELRMQHNSQVHGFHDRVEPGSAIPDSGGDHQWNYTAGSGTAVNDVIGSANLDYTGLTWESGVGAGDVVAVLNGVDDKANLSDDVFTSMISGPAGTLFAWVRNDSSSGRNYILSTQAPTLNTNNFLFGLDAGDNYDFSLSVDGSLTGPSGGTPSANVGDWVAVAGTVDATNMTLYLAEPPAYDVTQIGQVSSPSSGSGTWERAVGKGYQPASSSSYFTGSIDVSYFDSLPSTQSELQSFVDDTKSFYE